MRLLEVNPCKKICNACVCACFFPSPPIALALLSFSLSPSLSVSVSVSLPLFLSRISQEHMHYAKHTGNSRSPASVLISLQKASHGNDSICIIERVTCTCPTKLVLFFSLSLPSNSFQPSLKSRWHISLSVCVCKYLIHINKGG